MEKNDENVLAQEPAEEEDPNVANLLVTKSERAPATDAGPAHSEAPRTGALKTATLVFIAGLVICSVARRLFSKPRRYHGQM